MLLDLVNPLSAFRPVAIAVQRSAVSEVTQILQAIERGDGTVAEDLLPLVYAELRELAAAKMAREASGHTLQATALVHEAWIRLVDKDERSWENRAHFFGAAAEAMRRVLIDHARRKQAGKRGGGRERIDLATIDVPDRADEEVLLRISDSLDALAGVNKKAAELVKLRFFTGLSVNEVALALGVTDRTARRYWRFARAWLFDHLSSEEP